MTCPLVFLLRIYFIGDGQYRGTVGDNAAWSGRAAWSGDITRHRAGLLRDLKLPADTGPAQWWLTQFDDQWPYARAAGDVYFSRAANQQLTQRSSASGGFQCDLALTGFLALAALRPFRRRRHGQPTVEIPARDSAEPAGSGVPREPSARGTGAPFARGTHPDLRRVRRGTPRTAARDAPHGGRDAHPTQGPPINRSRSGYFGPAFNHAPLSPAPALAPLQKWNHQEQEQEQGKE